jgi:hypothetical protein
MKPYTWIFLVCMLGLSGCQLLPGQSPTPAGTIPPAGVTSLPATAVPTSIQAPTPTPAKPLLLVSKLLSETGTQPVYKINIRYPEIEGANGAGPLAFNQETQKLAQDMLAAYRKDFQQISSVPENPGSYSSMDLNYSVMHGEHGLLSVQFTLSFYFAGAAHPNMGRLGLNFDLIRAQKIEMAQLFQPGTDYLKAIADYCTADLKKQNRLEFPDGALPKAENYQNWNITKEGLLISFDPYQVGPYAMGPSLVTIPYPALKGILKSDGPLAVLLK